MLDTGKPVLVEDMAIAMVRFSGRLLMRDKGNAEDIEILLEGLRPGERMFAELLITDSHQATSVAKVVTANEAWMVWFELKAELDSLKQLGKLATRELRKQLL